MLFEKCDTPCGTLRLKNHDFFIVIAFMVAVFY